jgi:hypothetical protein
MLKKLLLNKVWTVSILFTISLALYGIDFTLLGTFREISASFLGNLAFLPIYVIIVTLLFERVLRERERQSVMRKLKMVIGVFFSEVGNHLLKELSTHVVSCEELKSHLQVTGAWKEKDFAVTLEYLSRSNFNININLAGLPCLKKFMVEKRSFLVSLLENQNLLEHEEFTELLWATFHIVEELEARESFDHIPPSDIDHINGDIKRVFGHLSREWILYMQHLRLDYPYLFSLAVRLNPMIDSPDPVVYEQK